MFNWLYKRIAKFVPVQPAVSVEEIVEGVINKFPELAQAVTAHISTNIDIETLIDKIAEMKLEQIDEKKIVNAVLDKLDIDTGAIAREFDASDIANEIDVYDLANEIAENIDVSGIAENLSITDIASEVDLDEIAEKVAENITLPSDNVVLEAAVQKIALPREKDVLAAVIEDLKHTDEWPAPGCLSKQIVDRLLDTFSEETVRSAVMEELKQNLKGHPLEDWVTGAIDRCVRSAIKDALRVWIDNS